MSGLGLKALSKISWRSLLAAARALSSGKLDLVLSVRRRIEARLRDVLFAAVFAMAGLVFASAGGVFLLMALWGELATRLGPNGASLSLGLVLLGASLLPLALAARRATRRRRKHA